MALKFTNTSAAGEHINVLVYGRSGVGKTFLCASAPKPIIISTESGLLSIADYDIPVIEVQSLDDLLEAYDIVSSKKGDKFTTVCLDSLSDIAEVVLSAFRKEYKDGRQAYGELNTGMADAIRKFRDLKRNVYFIAKSETYEMPSGMQGLRPKMPGRTLTADLPFFFDEVLCLMVSDEDEDGNTYRYLQTRPTATLEAKDRSGKLDKMEQADLKKLFKKLKGGK